MKIAVLAAYAEAVENGTLSADARVRITDWDALYLPGTDGDAHPKAIEGLRDKNRVTGETVSLADLVSTMIVHSDNAACDYLLRTVGRATVDALPANWTCRPIPRRTPSWESSSRGPTTKRGSCPTTPSPAGANVTVGLSRSRMVAD